MSPPTFYIKFLDGPRLCKSERGLLSWSGEPVAFSRYVHAHEYLSRLLSNPEGLLGMRRDEVFLHVETVQSTDWL